MDVFSLNLQLYYKHNMITLVYQRYILQFFPFYLPVKKIPGTEYEKFRIRREYSQDEFRAPGCRMKFQNSYFSRVNHARSTMEAPSSPYLSFCKRALFFARICPMEAHGFRRRHGPPVANKSRNTEVPRTREFHVCRWNLISAAFVMKHDRAFSLPFLPPLPRVSFRFCKPDKGATSNRYLRVQLPDEF